MSQKNNGETESGNLKLEAKIEKFVSSLDSLRQKIGLDVVQLDDTVPLFLNMSMSEVNRMMPIELYHIEQRLIAYSFSLQSKVNRATAQLNYASRMLSFIVAKEASQYDTFTRYEMIENRVIRDNSYAAKIQEFIIEQKMVIDEFNYLSQSILRYADTISKIAKEKGKHVNQ